MDTVNSPVDSNKYTIELLIVKKEIILSCAATGKTSVTNSRFNAAIN